MPSRLLSSALAALCVAAAPARARGQAGVRLQVEGTCPSRARAEAALRAEGISLAANAGWTVEIQSTAQTARLALRRNDREVAARAVQNEDCGAIADAFALIVGAHLAARPHGAPSIEPAPGSGPPGRAASDVAISGAAATAPERGITLGVRGGFGVTSGTVPLAQLDASLWRGRWRARTALTFEPDSTRGDPVTEINRQQWTARAELGRELASGRFRLRPGAGGGVALSRVHAPELDAAPTVRRAHPFFSGSAVAGAELGGIWLCLEAAALVFPIKDHYESGGVIVADSPRAELLLGIGLEVDLTW